MRKTKVQKSEALRERALRLFDMILEETQGDDDEIQVLEALKDAIDDYLFKYAGGEEE